MCSKGSRSSLSTFRVPSFGKLGFLAGRGWRSGYFALAAAVAAIIPITFFGLREPGDAAAKRARGPAAGDFRTAIRSPTLWCLALSFALAAGAMAGVVFHFVPILQSQGLGRADGMTCGRRAFTRRPR
jgi:hypothetical protein